MTYPGNCNAQDYRKIPCTFIAGHAGPHSFYDHIAEDNRTLAQMAAEAQEKLDAYQKAIWERELVEDRFSHPIKVMPGDWLNSLSSEERKEVAMFRGLICYFPDALAMVARHSVRMNEKHNPGEPVHWARGKSTDQDDCIMRHTAAITFERGSKDEDGAYHIACRAWRALAALQEFIEDEFAEGTKL